MRVWQSIASAAAVATMAVTVGVGVHAPATAAPSATLGPGSEIDTKLESLPGGKSSYEQCTIGVIANGAKGRVAVTAGHCAPTGPGHPVGIRIPAGSPTITPVGQVVAASSPRTVPDGNGGYKALDPMTPDWGVMSFNSNVKLVGGAGQVQPTHVGRAKVGEKVCKQGVATGWKCGSVVTVDGNRILTDIPVSQGDSGSSLIDTKTGAALGILSTSGPGRSLYWDLGFILKQAGNLKLVPAGPSELAAGLSALVGH